MENKQLDKMLNTKIPKLIISLSIPTVISMMVTTIYNTADAYFVSKLGTSATGAVGIVFSLMSIIQAMGFTIGMGTGSTISRFLGSGKEEEASRLVSGALFMGLAVGAIFALSAYLYIEPLMNLFGATPTILPYAISYARYIIIGAPIMIGAFILNNILRSQGRAKYAMIGITSGGILNVALDPIFIFTLNMGTAGAALATLVSQCISFTILLICVLKKSSAKLKVKKISRVPKDYLLILKTGMPSLSRQGLASIATMLLNNHAAVYGDPAVAAMSVVGKIFMIIFSVMIGIGQGMQPVVGYNYGAKKFDRVRTAFCFTLIFGGSIMTALSAAVYYFAPSLVEQFTKGDMAVIEIGVFALRAQCLMAPAVAIGTVCNMSYQMAGKAWTATLLACARQGIFFVPLIVVLPRIFGLLGVQLAQPGADFLTAIFSIPFGIHFLHSLRQ